MTAPFRSLTFAQCSLFLAALGFLLVLPFGLDAQLGGPPVVTPDGANVHGIAEHRGPCCHVHD